MVYAFNADRNNFKYDKANEIKMYREEVQEFFEAKTIAQRLDALVDCEYVRMGTMLKLANVGRCYEKDMPYPTTSEKLMVSILIEELGASLFDKVIRLAEEIVCEINATKGKSLDKDGKVQKDGLITDATVLIGVMLEEEIALDKEMKVQQQAIIDREMCASAEKPDPNVVG